ncbi:hypothetical protein EP331_06765 [bacterium]|nr:MAG: hypothetical protein EP331_06765 [bacterium]
MNSFLRALHLVSYSKFVFFIIALVYIYLPLFNKEVNHLENVGIGLIFLGIGLSLDSLRDQNVVDRFSKKIYKKPSVVISIVSVLLVIFVVTLGLSLYALITTESDSIRNIAVGLLCTCLGGISMVRQIIETSRKIKQGEIA